MNLHNRSNKKELLDQDDIPFEDIRRNMQELDFINTWLGGHQITVAGLQQFLKEKKEITICEIGCGGGDNLVAILKAFHKGINIHCTGIDIKKECIDFAKKKNKTYNIQWIASDYRNAQFEKKPDIIFSSLFCHHFTNEELIQQLQWMQQNSNIGYFINDLQRHILAYHSIRFLTSIFSRSYLVKNDAPLSVARGFTKKEWETLLHNAGIKNYSIQWKWAFRFLITSYHD